MFVGQWWAQNSKKEHRSVDYSEYRMGYWGKVCYFLLAALFLFALAYVFYHSVFLSLLVTPLGLFYPRFREKQLAEKRRNELNLQFKEALGSLASSLSVGRSVESAFKEALKDLMLLYQGNDVPMVNELKLIVTKLEMNETVEEVLQDFAVRSRLEDVQSFVDVFVIGKRSGGNMIEIIKNTSAIISDKAQIKEEIKTLLAQRKFEQRVLNIMPVMLIIMLSWSTGDYMRPIFETGSGRIVMTVSVVLLAIAYFLSKKITDIEV